VLDVKTFPRCKKFLEFPRIVPLASDPLWDPTNPPPLTSKVECLSSSKYFLGLKPFLVIL
jgi:hypothetical protein